MQWQRPRRQVVAAIPGALRDWLLDEESLTSRLQQACTNNFKVEVVAQQWQRPLPSERRLLALRDHEYSLVRQVKLLCNDQLWVYARTVIPARSVAAGCRQLTRLGNKPLGAKLFADKSVIRGDIQVASLSPQHIIFQPVMRGLAAEAAGANPQVSAELWGRRSLFYFQRQPLLVSEFFLPAICSQPCRQAA